MSDPTFLPFFFGLLGAGWLLGRHWNQIIAWLLAVLNDGTITTRPVVPARRNLQLVRPPFDFERGGDAA